MIINAYKSLLTLKPGPGGSEVREVNPVTGSDANLPFLQQMITDLEQVY